MNRLWLMLSALLVSLGTVACDQRTADPAPAVLPAAATDAASAPARSIYSIAPD